MSSFDKGSVLLQAGVLGAGLLSGLFFIFSFCVMGALDEQPPASAIATMNSINVVRTAIRARELLNPFNPAFAPLQVIVNPLFMLVFMGTPLVCVLLLQSCVQDGLGESLDNKCTAAGALGLIAGEFLLTLGVHIPMNDALAAYAVGSSDDASTWARYYTTWTPWNHVRMLASMATVILLSAALHLRAARLAAADAQPRDPRRSSAYGKVLE